MSTKEDYRRYARECVELLRAVADEKTKAALSHMAQVWLRLADQKDDPPQGAGALSTDAHNEPGRNPR